MEYLNIERKDEIAIVTLCKGKVHELSEPAVDQLHDAFRQLKKDETVRGVVLTGTDKFFSFGLDIPGFLSYQKTMFAQFLIKFTDLYRYMFIYPKPIIAAINGHAIAGGCMLANTCDLRVMVTGKSKISLNEITFGSSVFAGAAAMLKYLIGGRNAEKMLLTGKMFSAEEAAEMGLIDKIVREDELMDAAIAEAKKLGAFEQAAYTHIKRLLRGPVVRLMEQREEMAISEFNDIWYSANTWKKIQEIKIKE